MITPLLIQVIFWVGTAVCLFAGVSLMAGNTRMTESDTGARRPSASSDDFDAPDPLPGRSTRLAETGGRSRFSTMSFVMGVALILVGPVALRVYCELAIIFFKIHDELKESNDRSQRYRS